MPQVHSLHVHCFMNYPRLFRGEAVCLFRLSWKSRQNRANSFSWFLNETVGAEGKEWALIRSFFAKWDCMTMAWLRSYSARGQGRRSSRYLCPGVLVPNLASVGASVCLSSARSCEVSLASSNAGSRSQHGLDPNHDFSSTVISKESFLQFR